MASQAHGVRSPQLAGGVQSVARTSIGFGIRPSAWNAVGDELLVGDRPRR